MTLYEALRDALARITAAREAIGDGDSYYACEILFDLEVDLAGIIERREERWAA